MDIKDFRRIHKDALDVMTKALARLEELQPGQPDSVFKMIEFKKSKLELELRIALITQKHLEAGDTVVEGLSDADSERLDQLAKQIDEAIERDTILEGGLDIANGMLTTASDIRSIIDKHARKPA